MKSTNVLGMVLMTFACVACDKERPCTAEEKANFCLTLNGKPELPDSLTFIREREMEHTIFDTLGSAFPNCFSAAPGKQRILVYRADSLVFQSDWVQIDAQGSCNVPEAKTVDIPL